LEMRRGETLKAVSQQPNSRKGTCASARLWPVGWLVRVRGQDQRQRQRTGCPLRTRVAFAPLTPRRPSPHELVLRGRRVHFGSLRVTFSSSVYSDGVTSDLVACRLRRIMVARRASTIVVETPCWAGGCAITRGVLRLREPLASPTSRFAQDDKYWLFHKIHTICVTSDLVTSGEGADHRAERARRPWWKPRAGPLLC